MQRTGINPRRDFLKKISITAVSLGAFSLLKFKKSKSITATRINTLTQDEANDIIRNKKFPVASQLKPAPAPNFREKEQG